MSQNTFLYSVNVGIGKILKPAKQKRPIASTSIETE